MNTERIALHKTFEKDSEGKRQQVIYLSDGKTHEFLPPKKFQAYLEKHLPSTTAIRATFVNATDKLLIDLDQRGNRIEYAYWHDTGISSGLAPEEITALYASLPEDIFRSFKPRSDYAELKRVLSLRNAIVQFAGDAMRRLKQAGRDIGVAELDDEERDIAEDAIKVLRKGVVLEEGTPLDKHVARLAAAIPACVLFKDTACIADSWIMAASFVAFSGGFDRFEDVASLWHYCGQHVVDGGAPRRHKGSNIDWNPSMRTMLYQLGSSIIKNRANPWRAFFDQARAYEIATHDEKHPGCKTKDGHCTMRASRKMVKEIVKRFFLAEKGLAFEDNHNPLRQKSRENQAILAR